MDTIKKFHQDTRRPLDTQNGNPIVTCQEFENEDWITAYSLWIITAKNNRNELFTAGSCKKYLSHVKEYYKKVFPNASIFRRPNENWFLKLSSCMEDEVFRRLIDDGDELCPNKANNIRREELNHGLKVLLTKDDGKTADYIELIAPICTSRQATGRYQNVLLL